MFSHFGNIYAGMAFTPNKDQHAKRAFLPYAEATLAAYLQGQEKAFAVHDVVKEMKALFQYGSSLPASLIAQALQTDHEEQKEALITEALQMIAQLVRRGEIGAP